MKNKKLLSILIIGILLFSVAASVYLAEQNQEIRKKAAETGITLGLYPSVDTFNQGESKVFELKAVFDTGIASEKLDYFKTELTFDKSFLKIPDGKYIDTSMSGLGKIFRVDGPSTANDAGKIIIELGALTPGGGPATDKPFTVAKIYFQGLTQTSSTKNVSIGNTQVANNRASNLSLLSPQGLSYTVGPLSGVTPTPIPVTISDNFDGGSLDTNVWSSWLSPENATGSVKVENGVLRSNIAAVQNFYRAAVAELKNKITGDFDSSVDLKTELGGDPYGADTGLIFHDDPWENQITMFLRKETGSILNLYATSIVNKQTTIVAKQAISGNSATVKIQRIGQTAKYYYKDSNGQFILLGSQNNVFSGDGRLALHVNSWEPNYPTVLSSFDNFSAKVNFLSVSGPTLTPIPTPAPCLTLPQADNFDVDGVNGFFWEFLSDGIGSVVQENKVLKASLPGGNGFQGVNTVNKVCGDFDVRVDFNQFTSSGQPEGDAVMIIHDETNNAAVIIQRYSKGNEQGFWTDMEKPDGTFFGGTQANSTATTGILRIRRQGSIFTTYYDDGSGWKKLGYYSSGFSSNANVIIGVGSFDQNPSVSANFDNFNLTQAIPDPSITPIPTSSPTPTASPSPTPPSGREKYIIDVGDKQSLVINIGPSINPQIRFKAKLASLRAYPELYLKLRVKDELAFLDKQNNSTESSDTCNNPTAPDKDFYIPMKATGDVYSPVQQISQPAPSGVTVALVTPDGWVILDGMVPGRYYTLFLKGPKTRKSKMVEHFLLQPNQVSTQDFDWSGKLLDPGDLPDPANGNKQDCTINSADWSLEKTRIGANDGDNLAVCDVNYDGICNAGDSVAILDTLSKRPDDDQ